MDTEILIVGGGPAGASTAFHLAKLGMGVTLVDRAEFPRDKICAEYLSPETARILATMGVLEAVDAAGAARLAGMLVRAPNGQTIKGRFDATHHGYQSHSSTGIAIRRTILDSILLQRVREVGVTVLEGSHVTDVTRDNAGRVNGVRLADRGGISRTLSTRLVVGADGLRSVVGRRLRLVQVSTRHRRIALVAHYRGLSDMGELGEMHVESDGYVGLADVGQGLTNVALVVPANEPPAFHDGDREAFLSAWIARRPHLAPRFANAERLTPVRATGPFASCAKRAWAPGAVLVGDAADFYDPFTGEGVYTALRGGEMLAPFAARAVRERNDAPLAEYDKARRKEFSDKWRVERIIGATISSPTLINFAARALARRADMADVLIGVTGDFIPARRVLRFGYIAKLLVYGV